MAEYAEQSTNTRDDGFVCRDHDTYVERMKAQAWGQDDLALAQNRQRSGLGAYSRTRRWKHARDGALSPPALHEGRQWTFEEMAPEPIGPAEGMPQPVDVGALRFNDREVACVHGDRSRSMATMMWGAEGFGKAALGQEVNGLFQWLSQQRALVEPITQRALPTMLALQSNGVLDDDFRVVGEAHVDALLYDIARSGRVEQYPAGESGHATRMLDASRALIQSEIQSATHLATIRRFEGRADGMRLRVQSARAAINAWYQRRALAAENRAVAGLIRERDNMVKWADGLAGLVTGCASIVKSASAGSAVDQRAGAASASAGLAATIAKLIVHQAYEKKLDAAFERIGHLRSQAEASESRELVRQLNALEVELRALHDFVGSLQLMSRSVETVRGLAFARFGSQAALATDAMRHESNGQSPSPFAHGTRGSRGQIQRLLTQTPRYQSLLAFNETMPWPRLTGEMPMASYIYWSQEAAVIAHMAEEASKLRWWKARVGAVARLAKAISQAIESVGIEAGSLR